ncbi:hypothetical protein [Aestuariicoccus sp. MJ-SS9]|uniref:hypothetical protein n=1 Tax=Aestuariicoccus sp. MJ-SS9 TaxID=3079855 RepID=UPI00290BD826|nr:hypothetical protein [Aestuariicoccus sp. MJ-SS9]MDU8912335.1 hypothetical protein [Aestuariicoccus sp. MJ-SS9]
MRVSGLLARGVGAVFIMATSVLWAGAGQAAVTCPQQLAGGVPERAAEAPTGSAAMSQLLEMRGRQRDAEVVRHVLAGNIPQFLRHLAPVSLTGKGADGKTLQVTLCVTPDYLAVGDDRDFVRVPMGLAAAARIATETGFLLPTPMMVDAIYRQAVTRLPPQPMKPTAQMESTAYFVAHNQTLDALRMQAKADPDALTAGLKKDIVLTTRLRSKPGRVPIYGWHRTNGKPIQPLSSVHGADYADYSHGVRLVSRTAFVNGKPRDLAEIIQDPALAPLISSEGPIADPERLLAAQY